MRARWPIVSAAVALVALAGLSGIAAPPAGAGASRVEISASNFRFCPSAPCQPDDQAYVRSGSGNVEGTDNLARFVEVHPGDTVVWTYRDTDLCDRLATGPATCPGHEVQFEPSGEARGKVGFMPARQGPSSVSWQVPTDAQPGHLLRYYCDLNDHWALGVTGGLIIAGAR